MNMETLANAILSNCEDVSNKKLQKLSYYAYAWYLTLYDNEIADMTFEAWEHGPVCRRLYNKYRVYGWNNIPCYSGFLLANEFEIKFVRAIMAVYGQYSADELEMMTHAEAPWLEARSGLKRTDASTTIIHEDTMKRFYGTIVDVREKILSYMS